VAAQPVRGTFPAGSSQERADSTGGVNGAGASSQVTKQQDSRLANSLISHGPAAGGRASAPLQLIGSGEVTDEEPLETAEPEQEAG